MARPPKNLPKYKIKFRSLVYQGLIFFIPLMMSVGNVLIWPWLFTDSNVAYKQLFFILLIIQGFLINQVARFTLATGKTISLGLNRYSRLFNLWMAISTLLILFLPAQIFFIAEYLSVLFDLKSYLIAIFFLCLIGLIMSSRKKIIFSINLLGKISLLILIILLIFVISQMCNINALFHSEIIVNSLVDQNTNFQQLMIIGMFLSGLSGNLVLSASDFIKNRKLGMGKFFPSQVDFEGKRFVYNQTNEREWEIWINNIKRMFFVVFLLLTIFVLFLGLFLSINDRVQILNIQEIMNQFKKDLSLFYYSKLKYFIYISTIIILIFNYIKQLNFNLKIFTENLLLLKKPQKSQKMYSIIFYIALWFILGMNMVFIYFFPIKKSMFYLLVKAFLSGFSFIVTSLLVIYLNKKEKLYRNQNNLIISFFLILIWLGMFVLFLGSRVKPINLGEMY